MPFEDDPYFQSQFVHCPERLGQAITSHHSNPGRILDFGCGQGTKSIALARAFPEAEVVGVDITRAFDRAQGLADRYFGGHLPENLSFLQIEPGQSLSCVPAVDAICSWSVLEHVDRPILPGVVQDMARALAPGGVVITQIAPLFFSPFGSHLRNFDDTPWQHLMLSHDEYRTRITSQSDEKTLGSPRWMFARYEELNRITAPELFGYFRAAGFTPLMEETQQVKTDPPSVLKEAFSEAALRTFELFSVHRVEGQKGAGAPRKWWPVRK